ncbi:MAG: hypothetical protein P8107_12945, partial [Spirochaetia bacterium]
IDGDIPALTDARLGPGTEIEINVTLDQENLVLVRGPVTGQSIHLNHGGADSSVEIEGGDNTILMDRVNTAVVWKDVTDSDAVSSIIRNYGFTPDVERTNAGHFENRHTLVQRTTDLLFVRQLARRNGLLFWLGYDQVGNEVAHFKKPPLQGTPVSQLVMNYDPPSIDSLTIEYNVEYPTETAGTQLDLNTKDTIDAGQAGSPLTSLGEVPLTRAGGARLQTHVVPPVDDSGNLQARCTGVLTDAHWFIKAECRTTPQQAGCIIRPHTLVEVVGAGSRHSGLYFVAGVKHTITAGSYAMDLELIRNAWSE